MTAATPAIEPGEQPIPGDGRLVQLVDTSPALLHSALPDGILDFFNRGWLDFLGARPRSQIATRSYSFFNSRRLLGALGRSSLEPIFGSRRREES